MFRKKEKGELAFGKIQSYCKYELFMERYRSASDFIMKEVGPNEKVPLLDVGAGEGYMKYFLPQENFHFHGVEVWPERLKLCESLGYKMISHDLEAADLPYPENTFKVVVASHVLEHLYDPHTALDRIMKVVAPGGIAVIGLPMHPRWLAWILTLKNKFFPAPKGDHHWFFAKHTLARFLSKYEVVDIRGFRFFSARRRTNLENYPWFYRVNTWLGKRFPYFTPEINAVLRKPAAG